MHYVDGNITLKKKHFYQVQGLLNILQLNWCDFIVRRVNPHDMVIERIFKDETIWDEMVLKLTSFYKSHLLPELAVPRHGTITGIRKPNIPWVCIHSKIILCPY